MFVHTAFSVVFQSLAMAARERGQGADEEDSDRSNLPLPGMALLSFKWHVAYSVCFSSLLVRHHLYRSGFNTYVCHYV